MNIIVAVLTMLCGVLLACESGQRGEGQQLGAMSEGDCITSPEETINEHYVDKVSCIEEEWTHQVLNVFLLPSSPSYPTNSQLGREAQRQCDRRTTYVLEPDLGQWEQGDRRVVCLQQHFGLLGTPEEPRLKNIINRGRIQTGECFRIPEDLPHLKLGHVELVDCSGSSWDYKLIEVIPLADEVLFMEQPPPMPNQNVLHQQATNCPFPATHTYIVPSVRGWYQGNMRITCLQTRQAREDQAP